MKSYDATLIAAAVVLCVAGVWCDAGCGNDLERSALGSVAAATAGLRPLSRMPVVQAGGAAAVVDRDAAVALGKALFWDQQAGSDGATACASCHFAAGADSRRFNIVHPGPNGVFEACGASGPSQAVTPCDGVADDRLGSQGIVPGRFTSVSTDTMSAAEECVPVAPAASTTRQVTARNAPSVVGAVFYRALFWDGRAEHGLASQAVVSALDPTMMSCAGRPIDGPSPDSLAAKLLARRPLQHQRVSGQDGVLGRYSAAPNRGLLTTYRALVIAAFGPAAGEDALTRFSTYWGQSIQAYEATLIPDDTPFDRYLAGDRAALTPNQLLGFSRFSGKGGCVHCHSGTTLSDATAAGSGDQGFHDIGLRPPSEDPGRAHGAFKTPQLRNVKLTAPYFHNGGKATLRSVVELYDRGGDFPNPGKSPRVKKLGLDAREIDALVDFLANALTDCRTEKERAPFDHPSLAMPDGATLPATGASGTGPCPGRAP